MRHSKTENIGAYCESCKRNVLFTRDVQYDTTNHILHLLLSIFTGGLWIPIWILCGLSSAFSNQNGKWMCTQCGHTVRTNTFLKTIFLWLKALLVDIIKLIIVGVKHLYHQLQNQRNWYVTFDGNVVGPVSTKLLKKGIQHGKIPAEAYVCIVGENQWQRLIDTKF